MMKHKKRVFPLAMAVAMTFATVSEANAAHFPFTGTSAAPSQDVIAANLDEITSQNSVTVVHSVPQVAPNLAASQMPNPKSAAFGVATAMEDPNMSQQVPDCPAPPPPPPNCNNVGQCGTPGSVEWSGWDQVSGGVCNGGGPGGWYVIPAGPAPANVYPPSSGTASSGSGKSKGALFASGIFVSGILTKCNGNVCAVTYEPLNSKGQYYPKTVYVSLNTLKNSTFYLPGHGASLHISGGNLVVDNSGVVVGVNAATNKQVSGASLAQQDKRQTAAIIAGGGGYTKSQLQNLITQGIQGNNKLMTYGNGAQASYLSQAIALAY